MVALGDMVVASPPLQPSRQPLHRVFQRLGPPNAGAIMRTLRAVGAASPAMAGALRKSLKSSASL